MHVLVDLLQTYGYLIIFIGTILEGETVVVLGGFAAYEGHLFLPYVILVAIVGSVVGDQSFFYFGRRKGRSFLEKRPGWHARVLGTQRIFERHQNLLIFGSRFMYGFRTIIPIVLGTSRVSSLRFFLLNILGALVWTIFFAFGGYVFGHAIRGFLGDVHRVEGYVILGGIVIFLVVQMVNVWVGRKEEEILRKEEIGEEKKGLGEDAPTGK